MALIQYDVNMALKFVVTKSFKEFTEYSNIPANIRLDQDEYVRLSLTSSEDVLVKTSIFVLAIRLQDVFKTSCQDVFKTFSRRIIKLKCSW